jgi:uncharacterized damage-inducible protein DinB
MTRMLDSLFRHQAWADAALLQAVGAHAEAAADERPRWTLHHMVMVQRGFLALLLGRLFDREKEMQIPASLDEFERLYRETHAEELSYVGRLGAADLAQPFKMPWIPGCNISVAEALVQVVMHSQNHRGQCLTRLRELCAKPPTLDFVLWAKDRPEPAWA